MPHPWHLCTLDGLSHAHTALPKVVQLGIGRHGVTRHPSAGKNKNVTVHMKVLSFTHVFIVLIRNLPDVSVTYLSI